jgi:hypothetical protein
MLAGPREAKRGGHTSHERTRVRHVALPLEVQRANSCGFYITC